MKKKVLSLALCLAMLAALTAPASAASTEAGNTESISARDSEAETIRDVQIGDGESCPADDSTIRRWKKAEALPALPVTEDTTGVK